MHFCVNPRLPLQVTYTARTAGETNFNIEINISRKTKNLTLNVKASGHSVSAQLLCENSQGVKVELSPVGLNAINLGEVMLLKIEICYENISLVSSVLDLYAVDISSFND